MAIKDKVKVEICGRSFFLTSADEPEYLIKIADKIDKDILKLMKKNIGVTFEQAAILIAMKYCDDCEKKTKKHEKKFAEDENLGKRLVEYSKELTRATTKIKALEKEIARLKKAQGEI